MEVRCNPSLITKCSCGEAGWEGERQGGREDADNRSQGQTGRLIRRKEGWGMGVGVSKRERERERERVVRVLCVHAGVCVCVCVCVRVHVHLSLIHI